MKPMVRVLVLFAGATAFCGCGSNLAPESATADGALPLSDRDATRIEPGDVPANSRSDAPPIENSDGEAAADPQLNADPIYSVAEYDPKANPLDDLASTVSSATAGGKRIILEVGGDW